MTTPTFTSVMPSCTVSDIAGAVHFYEKTLGFECTFTNGDPVCFAILKRGAVEIGLQTARLGGVPGKNGFYIKLTVIDALYAEYQAAGVKIKHPLKVEEYGMKEFMIEDPEGNTINFGEAIG